MDVSYLKLKDSNSGARVHIGVRATSGSVMLLFAFELGDSEIAFGPEDGQHIITLLEEALAADFQSVSGNHMQGASHRFRNLDGGAEAAFIVNASNNAIEITVERSDEGNESFYISNVDTRTLRDTLKSALKLAATPDQLHTTRDGV